MTPRNGSVSLRRAAALAHQNFGKSSWIAPLALLCALGCGHTEEEWGWQQDKLVRAQGDVAAAAGKIDQLRQSCEIDRRRAAELASRVEGGAPLSANLEERERANAEHRAHMAALETARMGAEALNKKLADLLPQGVVVSLRHSHLVITLPGDLVFAPFKGDAVSKPGKAALQRIAAAIKSEPLLVTKSFQVVGFTDDGKRYDGQFHDATGLSAMHAREVAASLVALGPLLPEHFTVAGFGPADPVGPNDTDENRKRNRRVEITMQTDEAAPQL